MVGFAEKSRVLLIAFLVCNLCILATFADGNDDDEKHDYTVNIVNVELLHKMTDHFTSKTDVRKVYYNETTMALEAVLDLKEDFPSDLLVSVVISQQDPKTNQWMEKVHQSSTFCEYIEKNTFIVNNVYKDTDFPKACPISKGTYKINNLMIDNSEFPKHLEESKWRAVFDLILHLTKESILKFVVEVDIVAIEEDNE